MHNTSRYGFCSLAITSLLLCCAGAFAQDMTFSVTPTQGFARLLVSAHTTVTLSNPQSQWTEEDIELIGPNTDSIFVETPPQNDNSFGLPAGNWVIYCTNKGTTPTGDPWQLFRSSPNITVWTVSESNPVVGPPAPTPADGVIEIDG